jgi:hypothetical protein
MFSLNTSGKPDRLYMYCKTQGEKDTLCSRARPVGTSGGRSQPEEPVDGQASSPYLAGASSARVDARYAIVPRPGQDDGVQTTAVMLQPEQ